MTDFQPEQQEQAGEAPVPGAAPAPVPAPEPEPPEQERDKSGRAAALEEELARLRADAVAGAKVLMRVLPPHSAFIHAGVTVGTEPTPVPAHLAAALTEAAGGAGVTLHQEA